MNSEQVAAIKGGKGKGKITSNKNKQERKCGKLKCSKALGNELSFHRQISFSQGHCKSACLEISHPKNESEKAVFSSWFKAGVT